MASSSEVDDAVLLREAVAPWRKVRQILVRCRLGEPDQAVHIEAKETTFSVGTTARSAVSSFSTD